MKLLPLPLVFLCFACGTSSSNGATSRPSRVATPPASLDASPATSTAQPQPQTEEECVDAWLDAHHLDKFGGPEQTMYPGGSPLLDRHTGRRTPRLDYVYAHQPDARTACHHEN